ncbi:MAG: helix-turn-helix domain-containing protein, partial [Candidatus Saccharimonas sp.]|nr:helix-turn-helix domain-containing protein [Planctomycetaceae bacterium]
MAISKKYLSLEEAAGMLKLKNDELIRLREKGEIRGFADRGTWKFKADDVEEFRRRRQPDSDPDVPIMSDDDLGERLMSDPDLQTFSSSEHALDEDDELGRQATVIRKGRESSSDSDVRLVLDEGLKGRGLTGSSGELPVLEMGKSDSDVRLVGDSAPRLKPDSDSDVKLVNPVGLAPDSDSDVKLVTPPGVGGGLRAS